MRSLLATILFISGTHAAATKRQTSTSSQWEIDHFTVLSSHGGQTTYQLFITGEGQDGVQCATANNVSSTTCPGAAGPSPFNKTRCQYLTPTYFYWELDTTRSPLEQPVGQPPKIDYYVKITYQNPDGTTLYGCSPGISANDTECTSVNGRPGETLEVPSSFNVTPSTSSKCLFL